MIVLKSFLNLPFAANRAIASHLWWEEESPDSTEQCTGEQPGISTNAEKYVEITESATENNYPAMGKDENVG